jgi:hypothetical protein
MVARVLVFVLVDFAFVVVIVGVSWSGVVCNSLRVVDFLVFFVLVAFILVFFTSLGGPDAFGGSGVAAVLFDIFLSTFLSVFCCWEETSSISAISYNGKHIIVCCESDIFTCNCFGSKPFRVRIQVHAIDCLVSLFSLPPCNCIP